MKDNQKNFNYFKNNYYKFKVEPFELSLHNYISESDIHDFYKDDDSNYLFKLKVNPQFYTFFIKADKPLNEHVIIDIDDSVMTIIQFLNRNDGTVELNSDSEGFAHSFAIPDNIQLNAIKLYGKGKLLLVMLPRLQNS